VGVVLNRRTLSATRTSERWDHKALLSGFTDVDHASDPRSFVRYLDDANSWEMVQIAKHRSLAMLGVRSGDRVLDVGCGTGGDARALARLVGHAGFVIGVDSSKIMIAEARRRLRKLHLPIEFRHCDAQCLEFPDASFDACRADRVFQYLENPRQALAEIIRVARPGARIVVTEPDWDSLIIAANNEKIAHKVVQLIRQTFRHSGIAHQLPILFKELGLIDVASGGGFFMMPDYRTAEIGLRIGPVLRSARDGGVISARQAVQWLSYLKRASHAGLFFAAAMGFGTVGIKP
jgi:ubiquinone/menaquinone biosynthesis C-methylase UbiE